jgi:hypothetical protein
MPDDAQNRLIAKSLGDRVALLIVGRIVGDVGDDLRAENAAGRVGLRDRQINRLTHLDAECRRTRCQRRANADVDFRTGKLCRGPRRLEGRQCDDGDKTKGPQGQGRLSHCNLHNHIDRL